jgi:hypothetical protein
MKRIAFKQLRLLLGTSMPSILLYCPVPQVMVYNFTEEGNLKRIPMIRKKQLT